MNYLENTSSQIVIRKLKAHFARYSIVDSLVGDNGSQFSSTEFANFSNKWEFQVFYASPGNPRANGKAESAVKKAKDLMRKAKADKADAYLDHRNTPSQSTNSSPAQKLLCRRTKTLLPTASRLLETEADRETVEKPKQHQKIQSKYYDQAATDLPVLQEGDVVRIKPIVKYGREWKKGQKDWTKSHTRWKLRKDHSGETESI